MSNHQGFKVHHTNSWKNGVPLVNPQHVTPVTIEDTVAIGDFLRVRYPCGSWDYRHILRKTVIGDGRTDYGGTWYWDLCDRGGAGFQKEWITETELGWTVERIDPSVAEKLIAYYKTNLRNDGKLCPAKRHYLGLYSPLGPRKMPQYKF